MVSRVGGYRKGTLSCFNGSAGEQTSTSGDGSTALDWQLSWAPALILCASGHVKIGSKSEIVQIVVGPQVWVCRAGGVEKDVHL